MPCDAPLENWQDQARYGKLKDTMGPTKREREIVRVRSVTTMNERASSLVLTGQGVGVSGGGAAA